MASPSLETPQYTVVGPDVPKETLRKIADSRYARRQSDALTTLHTKLWMRLRKMHAFPLSKFQGLGVQREYLGVNVDTRLVNEVVETVGHPPLPYHNNAIMYNLHAGYREMVWKANSLNLPRALIEDTINTMAHEVAHQHIFEETPEDLALMKKIIAASEDILDQERDNLDRMWRMILRDPEFH